MTNWWIIGIGGGAGSICRYWLGNKLSQYWPSFSPIGTFCVNVIGCLVLGYLLGLEHKQSLSFNGKLLLGVGFCGGFTTFSTFSAELMNLVQEGRLYPALGYAFASLFLGFLACLGGYTLSHG